MKEKKLSVVRCLLIIIGAIMMILGAVFIELGINNTNVINDFKMMLIQMVVGISQQDYTPIIGVGDIRFILGGIVMAACAFLIVVAGVKIPAVHSKHE